MPAVVLTTSGSALANVWPAVVEASLERIPLLVLSGDRPPELQDAGANQTMDQVKFFGGYAEWSATLPCPSINIDPAVVLTTVDQAVSRCRGPSGGAVHINCMFREPLAPTGQGRTSTRTWSRCARGTMGNTPTPVTRARRPAPDRSCWLRWRSWWRAVLAAFWWLAGWRILRHVRRCPISPPHWAGRSFPM